MVPCYVFKKIAGVFSDLSSKSTLIDYKMRNHRKQLYCLGGISVILDAASRGCDMQLSVGSVTVALFLSAITVGCDKAKPPLDRIDHSLVFGESSADPYQHSLVITGADNGHACGEQDCPPPDFTQPTNVSWRVTTSIPAGSTAPAEFKKLRAVVCVATPDDAPHVCGDRFNIISMNDVSSGTQITDVTYVAGGYGALLDLELWVGALPPVGPGNPPLMRMARATTVVPQHPN